MARQFVCDGCGAPADSVVQRPWHWLAQVDLCADCFDQHVSPAVEAAIGRKMKTQEEHAAAPAEATARDYPQTERPL